MTSPLRLKMRKIAEEPTLSAAKRAERATLSAGSAAARHLRPCSHLGGSGNTRKAVAERVFLLCETLALSGIVATLFCGVVMRRYARPNMSRKTRAIVSALF